MSSRDRVVEALFGVDRKICSSQRRLGISERGTGDQRDGAVRAGPGVQVPVASTPCPGAQGGDQAQSGEQSHQPGRVTRAGRSQESAEQPSVLGGAGRLAAGPGFLQASPGAVKDLPAGCLRSAKSLGDSRVIRIESIAQSLFEMTRSRNIVLRSGHVRFVPES